MIPVENIYFYKNASGVSDPTSDFKNTLGEEILISVSGDFTGASFIFEAKANLEDGDWCPVVGIEKSNYNINHKFTKAGLYSVSIEGYQKFRVRLEELESGSITIFGRTLKSV